MSDLYAIILGMSKELISTKYTFICDPDECDCLIEVTSSDGFGFPSGVTELTCPCGRKTTLLSVVNATIETSTQQKEEQTMETTTLREQIIQEMELRYGNEITELKNQIANSTMKLDWLENDVTVTKEYSESDIRHMVWQNKNFLTKQNEWYAKESKLRTLIEEVYADSEDQEALSQIADIFDIPLTKEIEVTAWIRVDMTIEVELDGGNTDLEDLISSNLTVDSYGSEISVSNHEVERVEEGAY